ncbi:kelch domain-containing protein 4-like [Uloborus diversus]|uniref:kelch domain-containing protein 4-like n=1 Tax=Uloborus diversus TaxID=327109 RepID=UPI002409BBCA|nr:kelch domain-containing protein 4-like [Uloborus diversus]
MGKKDKKKGKGAEKTALKTEKKAINKLKKDLAAKGEDDIEKLITDFQEQGKKPVAVSEEPCLQPTPRSGFSLCAHPEKEELVLFAGEYFNGSKTVMYNDLYFYNIKKGQWSVLQCSEKPPPRCSHQAVILSQRAGQLWVFGGEFASPSRSNFYHYKDLWVYHFAEKRWEQVKVPGAPSARSGHRMTASRKQLIVFGGFHESLREYKYFNDVHIFDLESYTWTKVEPTGRGPSPRSGVQMAPLTDGRIILFGGYSREKVKKDVDKGVPHGDMYYLQLDERTKPAKWKWVAVKASGISPSIRSGFCFAVASNNQAYTFGGVRDEDDDETLESVFHNDLFLLEMDKPRWQPITLHSKEVKEVKKKRRKVRDDEDDHESEDDDVTKTLERANISGGVTNEPTVKVTEDSIFTVKIGPQTSSSSAANPTSSSTIRSSSQNFIPKPRMNGSLVIRHGTMYLYGGIYEDGDKQLTLSDFYSLDIHKLDEWRTIVPFSTASLEWIESDVSESSEEDSEEDGAGGEDDSEEESSEEGMDSS